jgi:hypothetical protein
MAKTITQLPDATTVGASDEMIIQQSGVTKRATINELKTQVASFGANDITVSGADRSITNTGNFALSFGTNNTPRGFFGSAGGFTVTSGGISSQGETATYNAFQLINTSGVEVQLAANATSSGDIRTVTNHPLNFLTNNTERMRIDASGNVGIGTAAPAADFKLSVDGTDSVLPGINAINGSANFIAVAASNYGYLAVRSNHPLLFATNNTERMRIDASGNVGIGGTANAAAILDATSTTKGFLPPRMTTAERDAISTPPAGLMIYNTTTNKLNLRTASSWEAVTSS